MEDFGNILQDATRALDQDCFLLPIHGGDPVYRERVYRYELYHQLRARWPDPSEWRLNGEVDKQAHPYFQDGGAPKPDLIVHVPGPGNKHAVIEVKSCRADDAGIRKDLATLPLFANDFAYQREMFLSYGPDDLVPRIEEAARKTPKLGRIEIWEQREPRTPAELVSELRG